MDRRQLVALGLAGASLLLAVAFGVLTCVCGGAEVEPNREGDPPNDATCASRLHPFAPIWAAFAVMGGIGLWFEMRRPAAVLGGLGFALGIVSGLSAGFYGVGSGALLPAAGIVGRAPVAKRNR